MGDLDRAPLRISLGGMGDSPSSPRSETEAARDCRLASSSPSLTLEGAAEAIHRTGAREGVSGRLQLLEQYAQEVTRETVASK